MRRNESPLPVPDIATARVVELYEALSGSVVRGATLGILLHSLVGQSDAVGRQSRSKLLSLSDS